MVEKIKEALRPPTMTMDRSHEDVLYSINKMEQHRSRIAWYFVAFWLFWTALVALWAYVYIF